MKIFLPYVETKKQKTLAFVTLGILVLFSLSIALVVFNLLTPPPHQSPVPQNDESLDFIPTTKTLLSINSNITSLQQIQLNNGFGSLNNIDYQGQANSLISSINEIKESVDMPTDFSSLIEERSERISSFMTNLPSAQISFESANQSYVNISELSQAILYSTPGSPPAINAPSFKLLIDDYFSFENTSQSAISEIENILSSWRQNPPVSQDIIESLISEWLIAKPIISSVLEHNSNVQAFKNDLLALSSIEENVLSSISESVSTPSPATQAIDGGHYSSLQRDMLIMFIIGFIFLVYFVFLSRNLLSHHSSKLAVERQKHTSDQNAIMRLLHEMEPISNGDLTATVTVTEHVTGAIADSINMTLERLRDLVAAIAQASKILNTHVSSTRDVALRLNQATSSQTNAIEVASEKNHHISTQTHEISQSTAQASKVAQRAVSTSSTGSLIVKETISGMDSIRDQMQVTSKRIKRLGESAQEISGIIEFIKSISEQTSLLALNSAIRAATAGQAGNDFAVIADEVQHLSDRVTSYVSKIEKIIQDIQADTQKTMESTEQTTSEVVAGSRLAEDAGQALQEIENVAGELSDIITGISSFSQEQNNSADDIVKAMEDIKQLNNQTVDESKRAEDSAQSLVLLSDKLMNALKGFKISKDPSPPPSS